MSLLTRMFDHDAWANQVVVKHCLALPPEQLQLTAPGTAGTIEHTLAHLLAAEGRYLNRLGHVVEGSVRESDNPGISELEPLVGRLREAWLAYLPEADPERRIEIEYAGKQNFLHDWVAMAQAIHHGNEHRTQVTTIMAVNGLETPRLSGWAFGRSEPTASLAATTAESVVGRLFEHSAWATSRLLEIALEGDGSRLELTARGVYGSLWDTITHLVDSDRGYLDQAIGAPDREIKAGAGRDAVLEAAAEAARGWPAFLAGSPDPDRVIALPQDYRAPLWVVVTQAVHHANEHRANVTTILGANGLEYPEFDVWGYAQSVGAIGG